MNSRDKGKRGELELAHFLTDNGFPAHRGQQFAGGGDSPDVVCPALPFHIECKRVEAGNPYDWLAQATRDATGTGKTPVVFHRRNERQWIAVIQATDLLELVKKYGNSANTSAPAVERSVVAASPPLPDTESRS